jgi:hypothetical protein
MPRTKQEPSLANQLEQLLEKHGVRNVLTQLGMLLERSQTGLETRNAQPMEPVVDTANDLRPSKVCRRCGATGLHWVDTVAGWRLFDGDVLHSCSKPSWTEGDDEDIGDAPF